MYDQVLENFRKAGEATMQLQQDMLRQWGSSAFAMPSASSFLDQKTKLQKDWAETMTDVARRQKTLLDARLEAGIKAMEDVFKVAQAKDPQELKDLSESALKRSLATAKELAENEIRNVQTCVEKCWQTASKSSS